MDLWHTLWHSIGVAEMKPGSGCFGRSLAMANLLVIMRALAVFGSLATFSVMVIDVDAWTRATIRYRYVVAAFLISLSVQYLFHIFVAHFWAFHVDTVLLSLTCMFSLIGGVGVIAEAVAGRRLRKGRKP